MESKNNAPAKQWYKHKYGHDVLPDQIFELLVEYAAHLHQDPDKQIAGLRKDIEMWVGREKELNTKIEELEAQLQPAHPVTDENLECVEYVGEPAHPVARGWIAEILKEVEVAENKHPNWPKDNIHAASIVCEESGELIRAALQFVYEKGSLEEIKKEAIHTAATCIRLLKNLNSATLSQPEVASPIK